jgi:lipopolysaccharide biosynthesis glycosyltransferase
MSASYRIQLHIFADDVNGLQAKNLQPQTSRKEQQVRSQTTSDKRLAQECTSEHISVHCVCRYFAHPASLYFLSEKKCEESATNLFLNQNAM